MLMKFHEEISPTSFVRLKEAPLQKTPDGRVIGLFPLDYVLKHRDETAEMVVLPGNRRDKDTRRTRRGTSRVRGTRTPGGTAGSAVAGGDSCLFQASSRRFAFPSGGAYIADGSVVIDRE